MKSVLQAGQRKRAPGAEACWPGVIPCKLNRRGIHDQHTAPAGDKWKFFITSSASNKANLADIYVCRRAADINVSQVVFGYLLKGYRQLRSIGSDRPFLFFFNDWHPQFKIAFLQCAAV
jgi:hypothetical protein